MKHIKKLVLFTMLIATMFIFYQCTEKVDETSNDGKDIVKVQEETPQLVSENCIWIVGPEIRYNRTWYDGNDQILHLDSNNVSQPLNERVHVGAKVILIDITGPTFYEGTIADVMDGYTAEMNIDAPNISDGEMDGCILVYQ